MNTSTPNIVIAASNNVIHAIVKLILGALITFALLAFMASLIQQDTEITKPKPLQILGSIIFEEPENLTIVKTPISPIHELEQPPQIELPNAEPSEKDTEFSSKLFVNNVVDTVKVEPNLGLTGNATARPIVRINPSYPSEAASKGIEGWVQLGFNVNTDGSVGDVHVIGSEPKRIFDRAAIKALKRWKYKPSFENGSAVIQTGLSVMLEFNMDN